MLVGTDSSGSQGKHRAAGLGTALALATKYPLYSLTFNEPDVWQPRWYTPILPDGEQDVDTFVQTALDIAQYPFRGEQRRIMAWRVAQVNHDLVEPGSDLADWVYEKQPLAEQPAGDRGRGRFCGLQSAAEDSQEREATAEDGRPSGPSGGRLGLRHGLLKAWRANAVLAGRSPLFIVRTHRLAALAWPGHIVRDGNQEFFKFDMDIYFIVLVACNIGGHGGLGPAACFTSTPPGHGFQ